MTGPKDMPAVVLLPVFTVLPEHASRAVELFHTLQSASRGDEGCVVYTFYVDRDDPERFVLHEEWVDARTLAVHNEKLHVVEFLREIGPLLAAPFEVTRLKPIA